MQLRRVASLTLFLSLFFMLVSSLVLFLVPQGRVAYWADWRFLGLDKTQWGALHTNLGFLMILAGLVHLWFNWGPVKLYLKNRAREMRVATPAFITALAVAWIFIAATLLRVPPLVWIQQLGDTAKERGAAALGEPPYGHAELSSLRVFLRNTGLEPARAKASLLAAGIEVTDPEITVAALAQNAGLTPQALFEIMQGPADQRDTSPRPVPDTVPMGTGRKTLAEFCAGLNRDPAWAVAALAAAGIEARPDQTMRDIAEGGGHETLDLLDALRKASGPTH